MGLVYFNEIDKSNSQCSWGFYIGEDGLPNGLGLLMGYLAMEHVFGLLSLQILNSVVLLFNNRSIGFHEKLGFQKKDVLKKHILRNGNYEDVVLLVLLAEDWGKRSMEILKIL